MSAGILGGEGGGKYSFRGRNFHQGRVLRRGSKKGLSRSPLEGRSKPVQEYDPLRVHPSFFNEYQDHGKGGLSLRGVAVTTETATTAETWQRKKPINIKNFGGTPPRGHVPSVP